MATPLLLYLFNEASSGTAPTLVHDTSTGTAANATINYGAAGSWTAVTAGNGRVYDTTGGGDVTASLASTKVQTGLTGRTSFSFELVLDTSFQVSSNGEYFVLQDFSSNAIARVTINQSSFGIDLSIAEGSAGGGGAVIFTAPVSGVYVLTVVVDTTQATAANRILCYLSGVLQTVTVNQAIALNAVIDTGVSWAGGTGATLTLGGSALGGIYGAALYPAILASGAVSANSTAWLANNDANPNGGGAAAQAPYTRDHVAAPQSDPPDQGAQWARRRPISTVESLRWLPVGAMARLRDFLVSQSDPPTYSVPPADHIIQPGAAPPSQLPYRGLVDRFLAWADADQPWQRYARLVQPAPPASGFVPFSRREQLRELLAEPVFYWMGMRSASIQGQVSADAPPPRGIGGSPVSQWVDADPPWQRYARLVQGLPVNNAPGNLLRVIGAAIVRQWEAPDPDPQHARPSAVVQPPPPAVNGAPGNLLRVIAAAVIRQWEAPDPDPQRSRPSSVIQPPPPVVNAPIPFSRRWFDAVRSWDPADPEPVQRRRTVTPSGAAAPAQLPYIARAVFAAIVDSWPRVDFEMPWPFGRRSTPRPGFVPTGAKIRPPLTVRVGDVTLSVLGDI